MRLVPASLTPPKQLRELLMELGDGEHGFSGTRFYRGEMTLEEYLQSCCDGTNPALVKPGLVPQTVCWLVDEGGIAVGMVRVRHCLNDKLLLRGGHIGFYIRPAHRGRGYARQALRLALDELRKLGVPRALLTAHADNAASIRVIEACGGELENTVPDPDCGTQTMRFWIALQ
jgi:predicted acetyltransferase